MNVTRDVIVDLLPLYVSNELSADSRALVDAYMATDPELEQRMERYRAAELNMSAVAQPPADLEVRAMQSTRRRMTIQKWVFAMAWVATALTFSVRIAADAGHLRVGLVLMERPWQLAVAAAIAAALWAIYFRMRR